jgi:hypothetical protein
MSLLQVLDLNGAEGESHKRDGKISKQDIESLLKNPMANLGEDEHAFLNNMVTNWDKPQFTRLRDGQGLITPESIKVATGELRAQQEQQTREMQQEQRSAQEREARLSGTHKDFLSEKREGLNGMSIFDAADQTGAYGDKAKVDGLIGKSDLEALLNNPLQGLSSDDEEAYLRNMIDNWDKPEFKKLRNGGEFLTRESLKEVSKDISKMCGLEPTEPEMIASKGKFATVIAEFLSTPSEGLSGKSIFEVADQGGAGGDKAMIDGRIGLEDLKMLLNNPLQRLSSDDEEAFLKTIIERWDSPEVAALRSGSSIEIKRVKSLMAS